MLTYRPHRDLLVAFPDAKGTPILMIYPDITGHMVVLDRNGTRYLTDPKLWALYREADRLTRAAAERV